jgi:site-specific recombinase XerD
MNIVKSLENFLTYLKISRNSSRKTLEQYEFHIFKFISYLDLDSVKYENKEIDHRLVFLEHPEDSKKREEKNALKKFLLDKCRINVESVKIDDLNEFRLFIAEK